jgi:nucleoid DNA-binding protein
MNKQTTIRAIAGKSGLTYFQVQTMLEALIVVWSDELASGGQITLENFMTIKVTELKTHRQGRLRNHKPDTPLRRTAFRVDARLGHALRQQLFKRTN